MIIAANGAHKSGSTWLMHLALELRPCVEPPVAYRNSDWKNPPVYSIHSRFLKQYLADPAVTGQDTLFKLHIQNVAQRNRLLAHPLVRVLNIRRDLRDVVVSLYHHWLKDGRVTQRFEDFYWQSGRNRAWHVLRHHLIWDVTSPRYLCLDYERLLDDFAGELRRLAAFLETTVDDARIAEIQQRTSPTEMSRRFAFGPMNRVRKGISGEWQHYFTEEQLADLAQLQRRIHHPMVRAAVLAPFNVPLLTTRLQNAPRARRRGSVGEPSTGRN